MSVEPNTHSFIIRIWLEPREIHGASPEWRGVIEHVASGERVYINDVDRIAEFVTPYLEQMGVKVESR